MGSSTRCIKRYFMIGYRLAGGFGYIGRLARA